MRIKIRGPACELGGIFVPAATRTRAVAVIIPGSGPTNADGNSPLGIAASLYKLLAEALAPIGIASVRTDKRGLYTSAAPGLDPNSARINDYADDVACWAAYARARSGCDCVFLIGHSEGGLVALVAASRTPNAVAGLILMATPGRRLSEVLKEQITSITSVVEAERLVGALERGDKIGEIPPVPALAALFQPDLRDYLKDFLHYDPGKLAMSVALPTLVLQGDSDIQVSVADALALSGQAPLADCAILKNVNHVFKTVEPGRQANLAAYADPELPLAPGVADRIGDFVSKTLRSAG